MSEKNRRKRNYSIRNSLIDSISNLTIDTLLPQPKRRKLQSNNDDFLTSLEVLQPDTINYNVFGTIPIQSVVHDSHSCLKLSQLHAENKCFRNVSSQNRDSSPNNKYKSIYNCRNVLQSRDFSSLSLETLYSINSKLSVDSFVFAAKTPNLSNRDLHKTCIMKSSTTDDSQNRDLSSTTNANTSQNENVMSLEPAPSKISRKKTTKRFLKKLKTLFLLEKTSDQSALNTQNGDNIEDLALDKPALCLSPDELQIYKGRQQVDDDFLNTVYKEKEETDEKIKFRREQFASDHFLHFASNEDLIGSLTFIMDQENSFDSDAVRNSIHILNSTLQMISEFTDTHDTSFTESTLDNLEIERKSTVISKLAVDTPEDKTPKRNQSKKPKLSKPKIQEDYDYINHESPKISYELFVNRSMESLTETDERTSGVKRSNSHTPSSSLPKLSIIDQSADKSSTAKTTPKRVKTLPSASLDKALPVLPTQEKASGKPKEDGKIKQELSVSSVSTAFSYTDYMEEETTKSLECKCSDELASSVLPSTESSVATENLMTNLRVTDTENHTKSLEEVAFPNTVEDFESRISLASDDNFIKSDTLSLSAISEMSFEENDGDNGVFPSCPIQELNNRAYKHYVQESSEAIAPVEGTSADFTGSKIESIPRSQSTTINKLGFNYPHQIIYPHEKYMNYPQVALNYPYSGQVFSYESSIGDKLLQINSGNNVYSLTHQEVQKYQVQRSILLPSTKIREMEKGAHKD